MLFDTVEEAISDLLQNAKIEVPKGNYVLGKIASMPTRQSELPALAIYDVGLSFEEQTLGSNVREERQEMVETFAADGQLSSFELSTKPLRPITRVESPQGTLKHENEDFKVNYEKGEIMFNEPPEKGGRKSVVVSFFPLQSVSIVSGLRINAKYNLDVWAASRDDCNELVVKVVNAILLGRDKLAGKGIVMKPVSTNAIDINGGSSSSQTFGRRLSCNIETDLYVSTPVPAIERIELRKKELQSP